MNKKGELMDVIIWTVMAFVIVLFFGMWIYSMGLVNDAFTSMDIPIGTQGDNISSIAEDTFGKYNSSLSLLHTLAITIMFSMILVIFVSNYFKKEHPVFYIAYVLVTVVGIILSVLLSNYYETLLSNSILSQTLLEFTAGSFILLHLPKFTIVIGLLGALFLFIGATRDRDTGGGLI